jgi:hypothetical protein
MKVYSVYKYNLESIEPISYDEDDGVAILMARTLNQGDSAGPFMSLRNSLFGQPGYCYSCGNPTGINLLCDSCLDGDEPKFYHCGVCGRSLQSDTELCDECDWEQDHFQEDVAAKLTEFDLLQKNYNELKEAYNQAIKDLNWIDEAVGIVLGNQVVGLKNRIMKLIELYQEERDYNVR